MGPDCPVDDAVVTAEANLHSVANADLVVFIDNRMLDGGTHTEDGCIARVDDAVKISRKKASELKQDSKLVNLLRSAVENSSDDSGWAHLAVVGGIIAKQAPEFDPRNYGYKKLGELVIATKLFQIEEREVGDGPSKSIYLKDIRKR